MWKQSPLCTTTAKEEDITKNPLKPPMPPESVFCLILGYLSEVLYMSEVTNLRKRYLRMLTSYYC